MVYEVCGMGYRVLGYRMVKSGDICESEINIKCKHRIFGMQTQSDKQTAALHTTKQPNPTKV